MFDVIGKRRWFYAFSLLVTIPGLFFILLTPFTNAGLQFSVDFTGGTVWEIKFEDPTVTPEQVEAVFAEQGLEAVAVTTSNGFIQIKTEPIGLAPVAGVHARPDAATVERQSGASGSPGASASPAASPSPSPSPVRRRPRQRLGVSGPSASPGASASPSPSVAPGGNTNLPTTGSHGRGPYRPRGRARTRSPSRPA